MFLGKKVPANAHPFLSGAISICAFHSYCTSLQVNLEIAARIDLLIQLFTVLDKNYLDDFGDKINKISNAPEQLLVEQIRMASNGSERLQDVLNLGDALDKWVQLPYCDWSARQFNRFQRTISTQSAKKIYLRQFRSFRNSTLMLSALSDDGVANQLAPYLSLSRSNFPPLQETSREEILFAAFTVVKNCTIHFC